jgi:molybdopterin-binding protein
MKISARNQLKGRIVSIKPGVTTTHVKIDVGGQIVTAAITAESAEELCLKPGMEVSAIVKASDVMIGVDG